MSDSPAAVVVKSRRALPFFSRHPWVFAGAIERIQGEPQTGDEVRLVTHRGEFIARGLFNPHSNIQVRLYRWEDEPLDPTFWHRQVDAAIQHRRRLFNLSDPACACRLIFSEADGLSGLSVDKYGDWLVVQMTSAALARFQPTLLDRLEQTLKPRGMLLRTEKGIRESEHLEQSDGLLRGELPASPLLIVENGMRFAVDLLQGQKTGFFLDQRDNRAAVARYLRQDDTSSRRVLDLFCYSGGFGIAALTQGGAESVVGVDVSAQALELAAENARLNGVADRQRLVQSKVFEYLEQATARQEQYELIILDPPKMARNRAGVEGALRGYYSLNRMAVDLLAPGGLLVTCSCSGLVGREELEQTLLQVSLDAKRPLQVLEGRGPAPDHPTLLTCPETDYLQCFICRVI